MSQPVHPVLRYLRQITAYQAGEVTDEDLLARFLAGREEAAFEALVRRHGPMVLGVCRRLLGNEADAEDAFQATFLVLVRRARSLGGDVLLGPWLYGVAYRTALNARSGRARRHAEERRVGEVTMAGPEAEVIWRDLRPVLDEEIQRLPEKYRVPFVLCYLEGQSYEEVARRLRCPRGTVATRLARARERLRDRLIGRGLTLSAAALAAAVAGQASAAVPVPLVVATVRAAAAGMVSAKAAALVEGVLKAMTLTKAKIATALLLVAGTVAAGAGAIAYRPAAPTTPEREPARVTREPQVGERPQVGFLKKYRVKDGEVEAGFVPYKTEVVLGEPIAATFQVKNLSGRPFQYLFGGDYRGIGRHDRFKITATDAQGKLLRDPKAGPNGYVLFGGLVGPREVKPGDTSTEPVDLTLFRTFEKPGTYDVRCRFTLVEGFAAREQESATVETTFRLRVLPRTAANVLRVQRELVQRARRARGTETAAAVDLLATFAREQAVPDLVALVKEGDREHRVAALAGLGRFTTPEAVATALDALRDRDETVRSAAAGALGGMKTGAAVDALIGRLPLEVPAVAGDVLVALGQTKSPRGFPRLVRALGHADPGVRRAAVRAVALYGGDQAVRVLKRCATDSDLERREAVVRALVEGLRQPLQPEWVVPLIRAGKGDRGPELDGVLRLLRSYGGERAVPAMVACLDFDDPSPKTLYNFQILYLLSGDRGAPEVKWYSIHDTDGKYTEQQVDENRRTLRRLRAWLAGYENGHGPVVPPPAPVAAPTPRQRAKIERLIKQLGSEQFSAREAAGRELEVIGAPALGMLREASALSEDAEVRSRAARLAEAIRKR